MKPIVTDWTIVVIGSWNTAILNPDWFAKEVVGAAQIEVELLIEGFRPRMRFLYDTITIMPRTDRIVFAAREPTDAAMLLAEQTAGKILALLPVTPVSAIGVNFGYEIDHPADHVNAVFQLADLDNFAARSLVIQETLISRKMMYDGKEFNLSLRLSDEGKITAHANYHKSVANAAEALAAVKQKTAPYREHANNLFVEFSRHRGGNYYMAINTRGPIEARTDMHNRNVGKIVQVGDRRVASSTANNASTNSAGNLTMRTSGLHHTTFTYDAAVIERRRQNVRANAGIHSEPTSNKK